MIDTKKIMVALDYNNIEDNRKKNEELKEKIKLWKVNN